MQIKMILRAVLDRVLGRCGYALNKISFRPGERIGLDPFIDISWFLKGKSQPFICDIGANEGQTVDKFKRILPDSIIHSFEPSKKTFELLSANILKFKSVTAWNIGLGAEERVLKLNENTLSSMSSFLPATRDTWGAVEAVTPVEVVTLDSFAKKNGLCQIDVLKIDTQGYEYEVLKGARSLLSESRIKLIYLEVTTGNMYEGLPTLSEILSLLENSDFAIVSFYDQHHEYPQGTLHWCDVLFVHKSACF